MATFFIRTELYKAGTDTDGQDFIAERYTIIREHKDGSRFAYTQTFKGAERWDDREGDWGWNDVRDEAFQAAETLMTTLSDQHKDWVQIDPLYGVG